MGPSSFESALVVWTAGSVETSSIPYTRNPRRRTTPPVQAESDLTAFVRGLGAPSHLSGFLDGFLGTTGIPTMPPSRRSRSSRTNPHVNTREERLGDEIQSKFDERWNARFKELLDYRSEHGDCNVPTESGKLGNWVKEQRKTYKAGSLSQDRIDRLKSIGFKWALREVAPTVPWDTRYYQLVQYRTEHGDCDVSPRRGKLGTWVRHQRAAYKDGKLSQDRVDRLNSIGFKWALKEAAPTVPWETRFKELVRYKAEHGDCEVPTKQGKLGNWVSKQRTAYTAGSLVQDRIDRLNSIGFKWALQEAVPWETRFDELVRYKTKHGDCNVPASQGKLGAWVNKQRTAYNDGKIEQSRIDRLSSIGFKWALKKKRGGPNVPWETRFNELVRYKAKHGDCNVPVESGKLGTWVDTQQTAYKRDKLLQDRIDRLNSIGFDWTPPIGGSRTRKSLSSAQRNQSSSRRNRASLRSTSVESLYIKAGSETIGEGRDVTSVSLPAPSKGSHQNLGTDSDDGESEEIGALIYDQVMKRRRDTNEARPELCVSNTAGYEGEAESEVDMKFVTSSSKDAPIKTEEMIKYSCDTDDESDE